jgi:dTMP kinase
LSHFITLEGPEGCGKSTQLQLLATFLREMGYDVLTTREPGGTPIGEQIRSILLDPEHSEMLPPTEFLLFSAARAQHVGQVIRPYLDRGFLVLCDRYADSSLAYQGYGHQLDLELLRAITKFATGGLMPDLTVYLDLPIDIGLQRKSTRVRPDTGSPSPSSANPVVKQETSPRPKLTEMRDQAPFGSKKGEHAAFDSDDWNRMEQQEILFHERVRAGYLTLAAQEPQRWVVVDATRSVQEVQEAIRQAVVAWLGPSNAETRRLQEEGAA